MGFHSGNEHFGNSGVGTNSTTEEGLVKDLRSHNLVDLRRPIQA